MFKIGDFVKTRQGSIYRIDQILVHSETRHFKRLFLKVTQAVQRADLLMDPILQQPRLFLDQSAPTTIIGAAAIAAEKVWLVPVAEDTIEEAGMLKYDPEATSGGLIHVQWTIHYL